MNKSKKVKLSMLRVKIFFLVMIISCFVSLSFEWSTYRNIFDARNLNISGDVILDQEDYHEIIGEIKGKQIYEVNSRKLSSKLERNPYVKAARVSKHYPNKLNIDIVEREPIAIINNKKKFMIDSEAIILPNRNSFFESALIPMLSGFNPANDLYPEGDITLSIKVKEAIKILDFIQINYNELFNEIAELRINKDDEFEIILSEEPTIVILGQGDFHNKINILKKFDEALGQRQLTDYRLLDMRYSKQLVAREWI